MSQAFEERLIAAARPFEITENPFLRQVDAGRADRAAIRRYAAELVGLAEGFPRVLSSVLACCDHRDVRDSLLGNLLEEEGVVSFAPGTGVVVDPNRSHGSLARRLARAAGAGEAEINAVRASRPRWFEEALRAGDWIGPYAFFAVGLEASVPATFRQLIRPLQEQYGFSQDDLAFLVEHVSADERHGEEAAALIATIADTPATQAQALAGARRGGVSWWRFHAQFAG